MANTVEQRTIEYLIKAKDQASPTFNSFGRTLTAAGIVAGLGAIATKSIKAASNLEELRSKAQYLYGDVFPEVSKEAEKIALAVGRAQSAILGMSADMGAVLQPTGLATKNIGEMSTQLAKLSVDMASFHNSTDIEAFNALRSAITGETEPMKRFGVVLTQTNMALYAQSKGVRTHIQDMNQAQLATLRYNFILDSTTAVQGDAERTSGSFANQMRRLQGTITQLYETLGEPVLPLLSKGLQGVTDMLGIVIEAIQITKREWQSLIALFNFKADQGGFLGGVRDRMNTMPSYVGNQSIIDYTASTPQGMAIRNATQGALASMQSQSAREDLKNQIDALAGGGGLGGGGGSAKNSAEKLRDQMSGALLDIRDNYRDTVSAVTDELVDLEIEHQDKMASIRENLDATVKSITRLGEEWEKTQEKMTDQKFDNVAAQMEKVKQLKDELDRASFGNEGFTNDKLTSVVQNRMDGNTGDLSFKETREFNLTSEQERMVNLAIQLNKEQAALNSWLKQNKDVMTDPELLQAQERMGMTSFEKNMQSLKEEEESKTEAHNAEMERLELEKAKLEDASSKEVELYETRRTALLDTLDDLDDFRDKWIDNWQNIDRTSELVVNNLKKRLNDLRTTISQIDALMQRRADIVGGGDLTSRVTNRYGGGEVRSGELTVVGEDGPEITKFPAGTQILSASQSRKEMARSGSSGITVQGPLIGTVQVNDKADVDMLMNELTRKLELISQSSS